MSMTCLERKTETRSVARVLVEIEIEVDFASNY